jgi:hypothetical protein
VGPCRVQVCQRAADADAAATAAANADVAGAGAPVRPQHLLLVPERRAGQMLLATSSNALNPRFLS